MSPRLWCDGGDAFADGFGVFLRRPKEYSLLKLAFVFASAI
jgi:hypothetical protein